VNLESEIHAINQQLLVMGIDIATIKERNNSYSKEKDELSKVVKSLEETISALNTTITKKEGFQDGRSWAIKSIWSVVGGIVVLWSIWMTNSVVSNNADIANLKSQKEIKK